MILNTTLKKRETNQGAWKKFTIRKDNNVNNWTIE